jgi:predicted nucleic acid-binding protein
MIIIDTNILIYLYIEGEYTASVESLLTIDCSWAAPLLWRSEFRNVLALYLRKKIISLQQSLDIISEAEKLMSGNEYQPSSEVVLTLMNNSTCSAYDCEFISLAKQFKVPLITQNSKLLAEFPRYTSAIAHYIK